MRIDSTTSAAFASDSSSPAHSPAGWLIARVRKCSNRTSVSRFGQSGLTETSAICPLSEARRTWGGAAGGFAPTLLTQSGHEQAAFAAMHGADLLYLVRDLSHWGKPMRRREFISLLGVAAAGWPLAARAQQQAGKVPRIGFLGLTSPSDRPSLLDAFRQGLRELGWVEGQNIVIDYRYAEGRVDRLPDLAAELVRVKVDLIVSEGTQGVTAARNATETIPIVMITVRDPVGTGLIAS